MFAARNRAGRVVATTRFCISNRSSIVAAGTRERSFAQSVDDAATAPAELDVEKEAESGVGGVCHGAGSDGPTAPGHPDKRAVGEPATICHPARAASASAETGVCREPARCESCLVLP